jgi:DNA-binding protein Fis
MIADIQLFKLVLGQVVQVLLVAVQQLLLSNQIKAVDLIQQQS